MKGKYIVLRVGDPIDKHIKLMKNNIIALNND